MRAIFAWPLLKTVELSGGRRILYPFVTYCYLSLEKSLQSFINRPGFLEKCEEWRNLEHTDDMYIMMERFGKNFKCTLEFRFFKCQIILHL